MTPIEYNKQHCQSLIKIGGPKNRVGDTKNSVDSIGEKCDNEHSNLTKAKRTKLSVTFLDSAALDRHTIDGQEPRLFGAAFLHILWSETFNRMESLARSVHEGRAVDEASNFARWLRFSGLLELLQSHPQPFPLKVDGAALAKLTASVVDACGVIYKGGRMPVNPSQSRIDELNDKVDVILSHIAKRISPSTMHTANAGRPALTVIAGGVSSAASLSVLPRVSLAAG